MESIVFEVSNAGDARLNGTYHFLKDVNGKPCFHNPQADCYISFMALNEFAGGWGIRTEETNGTCYLCREDDIQSESAVWKPFGFGQLTSSRVPTVRCRNKRASDFVCDVQDQAWKKRKFSDAEVICEGVRTAVHRSTLCAASPVFDAAFSSAMQEGQNAAYEIKDSSPAAVEAMLRFIYTGVLDCPSAELGLLLDLAVQYNIAGLCSEVATKLTAGVTVQNVRSRFAALKRHSQQDERIMAALKDMVKLVRADASDDLILALG